jgi:4-diphosphocytidyl-2-C-methyl-D-erythritol kinase
MSFIEVKSFAKINLALNVTGKKIYYIKLKVFFRLLDLHDLIFIKKLKEKTSNFFLWKFF